MNRLRTIWRRVIDWFREHEILFVLVTLVLLFGFGLLWPRIVISIQVGHRGVLWSYFSGTKTNQVYPEGVNLILPWNQLTIYDIRFQAVERAFTVLSQDGLPVAVDLTARYRPGDKLVAKLHEAVGPNYVEVVVIPEVAQSLRTVIARYPVEELYKEKFEDIQKEVLQYAQLRCAQRYVILDQVLFGGVTLPPDVTASIQRKVEQQQETQELAYRLDWERTEAVRKGIEAAGIQEFQRVVGSTLTPQLLQFKAIEANLELAKSNNAKVVVTGSGSVPIIVNAETPAAAARPGR